LFGLGSAAGALAFHGERKSMKRLRHPIRAVREPFGTAGLVIACVALVMACTGAAFAATKLNSTQKKEVEKIAKKYAGAPGAPGAPGTAGAQGGPGVNGTNGIAGTNGTNAEASSFPGVKGGCTEGGIEVKSAKPTTFVCNGVKGTNGTTGFTETLPSGKTETGNWDASAYYPNQLVVPFAISFSIPLAVPSEHIEYLGVSETESSVGSGKCELEVENPNAKPIAPPGYLCVFTRLDEGSSTFQKIGLEGAGLVNDDSPAGAFVWFKTPATGGVINKSGTWAVTAPE
jgi:hypothetical protein